MWGGCTSLSRWHSVLKASVQVNVMSWQDVASKVVYFTCVCVLVSVTDLTPALVISAVTSDNPEQPCAKPLLRL